MAKKKVEEVVKSEPRDVKAMAKTVRQDRYLPTTMPVMLTGEVSSSCSVFCFLSSEYRRMVRIGMMKEQMNRRLLKVPVRSEVWLMIPYM